MSHVTERRIGAHICIGFIAYKVHKELERLIAVNNIGMSIGHVLDTAKTITTIRARMPENGTYFTKTPFMTEKHLAIKPLFKSQPSILNSGDALTKSGTCSYYVPQLATKGDIFLIMCWLKA